MISECSNEPSQVVDEVTGFITKRGKIVHSWKRRFFVLTGPKFLYFGNESRDVLMGGGICHGIAKWAEKRHGLILTCRSGRNFQLICDTHNDCQKWWRAFSHAVGLSLSCKEGIPSRARIMRSISNTGRPGAKKRRSDPANSAFLNFVDEVVNDNGMIEDNVENVPSSTNGLSSSPLRPNILQKCKSLFSELEERAKDTNKCSRAQSNQHEVFSSQKVKLDDFRLVQTVGKGGFGKVLKVQNLRGSGKGKIYAMKILRKQHVVDTRQVKTTKTERRILQQIDHPFVVKLRYAFQSSSKLYMIMDYYSGGSLFYHIERRGQFCENDVRFFAAEITLALEHLHCHGVIYRDLKLENILLDDLGHVALTDFGLSKDECNETNLANTFCGTPVYVAPEVIAKEAYGFSIDWWALGVVMYELLSGRVPFASRDRRRMFDKIVNSEVEFCNFFSKDAQSIIGELLAKDPDFRLGSFLNGNGGKDVQQHHFFVGYGYTDFEQVYRKDKIPPFRPSTYICESNVRGIEARDTLELVAEDICNFDNFTLVGSPR
jgi:serine/threonine protein kinase